MFVCVCVCVCLFVYVYVCMSMSMCVCMYVYVYVCMSMSMYVYVCVCVNECKEFESSNENENETETGDTSGKIPQYIFRMDAKEKSRREQLKIERGRAVYACRHGKKVCPVCGTEQKYEEVLDKKKYCLECNVKYSKTNVWSQVERCVCTRVSSCSYY